MSNTPAKRIGYIDAMRGFTMIIVVALHVGTTGFGFSSDPFHLHSISLFCSTFRMPLFFFISGFILYKADREWTLGFSADFIKKKFMVQIVPTTIFFLLFMYMFNWNIKFFLYDSAKGGFWFTLVLFYYFGAFVLMKLSQSLFVKLCERAKASDKLVARGESFIELVFVAAIIMLSVAGKVGIINHKTAELLSLPYLKYFFFFIMGYHVRQYFDGFVRLIENKYFTALVIILFFGISLYCLKTGIVANSLALKALFGMIAGTLGIICVFSFFYHYQGSFTPDKAVGNALQYIGKRTLDIYLLHYFFIPRKLYELCEISRYPENFVFNFFVTLTVAAIVIAFCLLVSNLIRVSPLLARVLFGVKDQRKSIRL